MGRVTSEDYIAAILHNRNQVLEQHFGADVLVVMWPINILLDQAIRREIEGMHDTMASEARRLVVMIETEGGYVDVVLGPIDPQFERAQGHFVPGVGYLRKFEELLQRINRASDPAEVRAELACVLADDALAFAWSRNRYRASHR